jgi:hypothetical protein
VPNVTCEIASVSVFGEVEIKFSSKMVPVPIAVLGYTFELKITEEGMPTSFEIDYIVTNYTESELLI